VNPVAPNGLGLDIDGMREALAGKGLRDEGASHG
jgi:hypothetical protein